MQTVNVPDSTRSTATNHTGRFDTTHWSVVLAAADTAAPGAHEALEKLCRTYWHPIYAFVRRQAHSPHAEKRGGGRSFLSLQEQREAETRFLAEPVDPAAPPDRAFEKQCALAMLDQVLSRLGAEFTASGSQEQFDALKVFVWGDQTAVSQVEVADKLGMTANALGVAVHRLRRRFGELLREAVAQTVASEDEIEAELRHLIAVISS